MDDLKNKLAEFLEVDNVNDADVLAEFEFWDSMTALSIMAYTSETYGIKLSNEIIKGFTTVSDLISYIREKQNECR